MRHAVPLRLPVPFSTNQHSFSRLPSKQGMIKLDRKARTLQLKVQVNSRGGGGGAGGKEPTAVRDLKQLSGGERSYTTVAFTLALGGQTEMPFRAMV